MDPNQSRELAKAMTAKSEELMGRLNEVLQSMGFDGLEIIEIKAVPREDKGAVLQALEAETGESILMGDAPCPTDCVVTPSGVIICTPRC
jgi:hypothetical protein